MELYRIADRAEGLRENEIEEAVRRSVSDKAYRRVLLLPPDYTRLHSGAGLLTRLYYRILTEQGAAVDILPALGTHAPMTEEQIAAMYGDLPRDAFLVHDWRRDVVKLGVIGGDDLSAITSGRWTEPVTAGINRRVMDERYDLILSVGQVVPHEVAGLSNHTKNLFVGVGGSEMINASHMIGAVCGMESIMGRDDTPVRALFDLAASRFLSSRPIRYVLTVTTAPGGVIRMHGLFIGDGRECMTAAGRLAQEKNMTLLPSPLQKCVVYLPPDEFRSTWLGNKAIYRTRMAMADGGELLILAPGVSRFGEDDACDRLIRRFGYRGTEYVLAALRDPANEALRADRSAAAHLIHGSSEGRFTVTYAVESGFRKEIEGVGFRSADIAEMLRKYDPAALRCGVNTVGGEEIYYIPNPALGLWMSKERMQ